MDWIAKRIEQLYAYRAESTAPDDLDAFWQTALSESRQTALHAARQEAHTPFIHVRADEVTFQGVDGTKIHGWFLLPPSFQGNPLPCIVQFHGYGGSKGSPGDYADWLLMGFAVFAIDVRGQSGETGDRLGSDYGMTKGWITQGILSPATSYYRSIALDGLRAIDWAMEQPEVDAGQIIVMGTSQGGGLALITTALHEHVKMTVANIPNMCHMDFGIMNATGSLTEAAEFLNRHPEKYQEVMRTLCYFDLVNLADRIHVPVMMSVSLKDTVCMPETIFAVYNEIPSAVKKLEIYPFAGHHVCAGHTMKVYDFIRQNLAR